MKTPEAIACAVEPNKLCVEGTCPLHLVLAQIAKRLNRAMDNAIEGELPDDPEAAGHEAAAAIQEADRELSNIDFSDCRPVDPENN